MRMRRITKKELELYNGEEGAPAFVAYQGRVYDVSRSFLWQKGNHQALHHAGADLTEELDLAPHDVEQLEKFPIVGILEED